MDKRMGLKPIYNIMNIWKELFKIGWSSGRVG
jgi:hypothetical protein